MPSIHFDIPHINGLSTTNACPMCSNIRIEIKEHRVYAFECIDDIYPKNETKIQSDNLDINTINSVIHRFRHACADIWNYQHLHPETTWHYQPSYATGLKIRDLYILFRKNSYELCDIYIDDKQHEELITINSFDNFYDAIDAIPI